MLGGSFDVNPEACRADPNPAGSTEVECSSAELLARGICPALCDARVNPPPAATS